MISLRRAMTPARRRRIHEREGGLCWHCRLPVPMHGPEVRYDHIIELWISQDDDDGGIFPAHTSCDAPKTAAGQRKIAKIKRLIWKNDPSSARPAKRRSDRFPAADSTSRRPNRSGPPGPPGPSRTG